MSDDTTRCKVLVVQISRTYPGHRKPAHREFLPRCPPSNVSGSNRRCLRARARVQELRNADLRRLFEEQRLESELAKKSEQSRRAGLSVTIARGAGLRGMDLSGVSDPFCVVLWNGEEVMSSTIHGIRGEERSDSLA